MGQKKASKNKSGLYQEQRGGAYPGRRIEDRTLVVKVGIDQRQVGTESDSGHRQSRNYQLGSVPFPIRERPISGKAYR